MLDLKFVYNILTPFQEAAPSLPFHPSVCFIQAIHIPYEKPIAIIKMNLNAEPSNYADVNQDKWN